MEKSPTFRMPYFKKRFIGNEAELQTTAGNTEKKMHLVYEENCQRKNLANLPKYVLAKFSI